MVRLLVAFFAVSSTLATAAETPPERLLPGPERMTVSAAPVPLDPADPARDRLGPLRFMGGVHLTSRDIRWGGLSALRWHGGVLMGASDEGNFFAFRPIERDKRLIGVTGMRVRRLAGLHGERLTAKDGSDFEALEITTDPHCRRRSCPATHATLSRETDSDIWTYRLVRNLPVGRPTPMRAGAAWRGRQSHTNGGVEALAGSRDLWLMVSEELRDAAGRASALLAEGDGDAGRELGVEVLDGFNPTDLAIVGNDPPTFLLLQRWYQKGAPNATRLSRFTLRLAPDGHAMVGPVETLATLRTPLTVDNFEGLAVRREAGRTFLYMISDDNFSTAQRTLLLKWELIG